MVIRSPRKIEDVCHVRLGKQQSIFRALNAPVPVDVVETDSADILTALCNPSLSVPRVGLMSLVRVCEDRISRQPIVKHFNNHKLSVCCWYQLKVRKLT